ncbi:hypothetical protein [Sphingomonas paeninsulae]|nr:hypothetical protein [Sphingomonas paeninsulae]
MRNKLTVLAFAAVTIATGVSGAGLIGNNGNGAGTPPGFAVEHRGSIK